MQWVGVMTSLLGALVTAAVFMFGLYKYFAVREREAAVRAAFAQVVDLLSSQDVAHRQAGAIMLRRFFDPATEQGTARTPYASEALNIIAATLRGAETGGVQKLLADGLAYRRNLRGADLQKTNLRGAYLGSQAGRTVDLSQADFYRADLTGASLQKAVARNAVFYQSRLVNTVLDDADLTEANFFQADLRGVSFRGARLEGASFLESLNIPGDVQQHLDSEGVYRGEGLGNSTGLPRPVVPKVFFSRPGASDISTREYLRALIDKVSGEGFDVIELPRSSYANSGAAAEVRRVMSGCNGVVLAAVHDLRIDYGMWRESTPDQQALTDIRMASSWVILELGIATGLGLPVLIAVSDGIDQATLNFDAVEPDFSKVVLARDHRSRQFGERFDDWVGAVREIDFRNRGLGVAPGTAS